MNGIKFYIKEYFPLMCHLSKLLISNGESGSYPGNAAKLFQALLSNIMKLTDNFIRNFKFLD